MLGPLDYIAIGYEGEGLRGDVFAAFDDVRARGLIRVLDLLFISKDDQGSVTIREISDLTDAEFALLGVAPKDDDRLPWFAKDDAEAIAGRLPLQTSAVVLLFEHTWAAKLRAAAIDAGGFVVGEGRVPANVVDEVSRTFDSATFDSAHPT